MHDAVLVLVGSDSDISCKTLMKRDSSTCICNKEAELVITHANSVHKFDDHVQMYQLSTKLLEIFYCVNCWFHCLGERSLLTECSLH